MLQLKDYQQKALDALRDYFVACSKSGDARAAFEAETVRWFRGESIPYNNIAELPGLPYVCLRLPTGGGKTLLGCHSVSVAERELLHTENAIVLWLAPSITIMEQTLRALNDRRHPYRQAVEATVGTVNVVNVDDALSLTPAVLNAGTTIILSTMQSSRVSETMNRRFYRESGVLKESFEGLPSDALQGLECYPDSDLPIPSLANLLYLHRPVVIVDEAHNARTELSFTMLARFNPACIIEFTATPDREKRPSNVLYSVSAAALKTEEMIKMPIRLEAGRDWKELLSDALACRKMLHDLADQEHRETKEYIRPIMLIQAQPHKKGQETISVETILETLQQDHKIPREEIAVATGTQRELDGIDDLSSPECRIKYIITMQALREGWDCPFAYVLCSVTDMHSATYVEQILGRVMRLPKAKWKKRPELNMAYAFATTEWNSAVKSLEDGLVSNGFERQEAKDLIVRGGPSTGARPFRPVAFMGTVTVDMPEAPLPVGLPATVKPKVVFNTEKKKLTYKGGPMSEADRDALQSCFRTKEGKECVEIAYRTSHGLPATGSGTPAQRGVKFVVPVLAIKQGNFIEQLEETHFLERPWDLSKEDALLTEAEFSSERPKVATGEVVVTDDGKIRSTHIANLQQHMLHFAQDRHWSVADLVLWLDTNILHRDISPQETGIFLTKMVERLMTERGIPLEQLVHDKYRLRNAAAEKIDKYRKANRHVAYQALLDDGSTGLVVSEEVCFEYDARQYPYRTLYKGRYEFKKHFYGPPGDLAASGEEFECAQFIDQLDEVECWVRNVPDSRFSFWIQTSKWRFYPDFVCQLKDGRHLIVEYKGGHLVEHDAEKKDLGELWENRSGGRCLFVMPTGRDYAAIERKAKTIA